MKSNEFINLVNRRALYSILQSIFMNAQQAFKVAGMNDKVVEDKLKELVDWCDKRLSLYEGQISEQVNKVKGWDK